MIKSILRFVLRIKPTPAPAEKPPMAVRNKPNMLQQQVDESAHLADVARVRSGPHGVISAIGAIGTPLPPKGTPEYQDALREMASAARQRQARNNTASSRNLNPLGL